MPKPILCLDFDACIHSYKSGWKGITNIPDDPVPGVFEWIREALKVFEIHVYSTRSEKDEGRLAMYDYIEKYDPEIARALEYATTKPRAFLTIDDRCIRFDGDWSDPQFNPEELRKYRSWYQNSQTS